MSDKTDDQFSEQEAERRRDDAVRRALNTRATPHKTHDEMKRGRKAKEPAKGKAKKRIDGK